MKNLFGAAVLIGVIALAWMYNVRARMPAPAEAAPKVSSQTTQPDASPNLTVVPVDPKSQAETVSAIGIVRSDAFAAVSARVPGRVTAILVHEGDAVAAGQMLARLDVADYKAQLAGAAAGVQAARAVWRKAIDGKRARAAEMDSAVLQAQSGLEMARLKVKQAEIGVPLGSEAARSDAQRAVQGVVQAEAGKDQAEIGLREARAALTRLEDLYAVGGVALVDVQTARTQVKVLESQLRRAEAALASAKAAAGPAESGVPLRARLTEEDLALARAGVRQAEEAVTLARRARTEALRVADRDIEAADAQVRQALAGQEQATVQIGTGTITAPIAGIVTDLTGKVGEFAQPGMALMHITGTGGRYLEVAVESSVAERLQKGTPLRGKLVGEADETTIATVDRVSPLVNSDNRTRTVRAELKGAATRLAVGTQVRVSVMVGGR